MSERTGIAWSIALPERAGRYFIRPIKKGHGRVRSFPVIVNKFGGALVAWAGPDLSDHFRMASVDRLHTFLGEPGLEWGFIDDVTDVDALYPAGPRVREFPR